MARGQRSVGADFAAATAVFGPSVTSHRITYRQGLLEGVELSAAPSLLWIGGSADGDSHAGIYTARAALKYAPVRHVAVAFGLGAGASAAGAFVSPDLGVTLAWENPYLVPFGSVRTFFSAPIAPRYVHFTTEDDEHGSDPDDAPDRLYRLPHFTYGLQVAGGLRAPLFREPAPKARPSLACAIGATFLYDGSPSDEAFMALGCGFDVGF